jgi:uncharacterized protein
VHLVHEMRRNGGRFRLTDSTGVAVILISTTTMASFGALVLARHQGLHSLGQVLTLGTFLCLTCSMLAFPALLSWLTRNLPEVAEEEERPPAYSPAAAATAEVPVPELPPAASNSEAPPMEVEAEACEPLPSPAWISAESPPAQAGDDLLLPAPRGIVPRRRAG